MALQALVFIALLGVAVGGLAISPHGDSGVLKPKLGSKACTFGPSYWCDHIRKSAECGMTSWCISEVWQYMDLPKDNDDICDICVNMVTQARDTLNSNETEEELKEVLEGSCNLIPVHLISEECDKLVDDFIPELIEVLTSELNPQVVCQTAGLCNSPRVDKLLEDHSAKKAVVKPVDTCDTCQKRTEALVQHVATVDEQQLLDNLLPICRDFGSYSDACAGDLAANIGTIQHFLQEVDSEGVCLLGNACPGLYGTEPLQLTASTGPAVDCDLCIHIVKHWRDILVANTTKEEFKEILDGICSKTKAWAPKCTQLVDEYYIIIYDFLVNDIRAHTICKAVGLCASPKGQLPLWPMIPSGSVAASVLKNQQPLIPMRPPMVAMAPLSPPEPVVDVSPPNHELHSVALKKAHVKKMKKLHRVKLNKSPPRAFGNDGLSHENPLEASPEDVPHLPLSRLGLPNINNLFQRNTELCDLCEFGMGELRKELMKDSTEDEITTLVETMCDVLPSTLTTRCRQFVEEYSNFVITLLAQEIDPSQICPALRLCPLPSSEVELESAPVVELIQQQEETVDTTPGCAICEYAMTTLLNELKDKKTEREIRDGLDRICDILPHTVAHECEELVNTFSEELIDMIASGLTADEICITLHLCFGEQPGINDIESNSIHGLPRLDGMGPHGMQFAGLSGPLSGLPMNSPQMPGQPEEWPMFSSEEDSSEEDDSSEEEDFPLLLPARVKRPEIVKKQSPVCVLCEFVMMQVKVKIDDNSTIAEIENALEHVCERMPSSIRDDCAAFVDNYAPAILDALRAALADPDTVCQELHLCKPQSEEFEL